MNTQTIKALLLVGLLTACAGNTTTAPTSSEPQWEDGGHTLVPLEQAAAQSGISASSARDLSSQVATGGSASIMADPADGQYPQVVVERASVFTQHPHTGVPLNFDTVLHNKSDFPATVAVYFALWDSSDTLEHEWIQRVTIPANRRWHRQLSGPTPSYPGTKVPVLALAAIGTDRSLTPLDIYQTSPVQITARPGETLAAAAY